MFEVYIQEQSVDPRLRNRMMVSLTAAAAFTVAAGIAGWTIDELDIDMVSAPQRFEIATLSLQPEPPPPPAPPERPTKAEAAVADQHDHGRPAPKPEAERPDSFLETPSSDRRVFSEHGDGEGDGTDDDHRDRIPRNGGGGSPCLIGMNCNGVVANRPTLTPERDDPPPKVDFSSMKTLYAPDPPQDELARTRTGLGSRRTGSVRVEFCIDARGKVSRARVVKRFPGDDAIDSIARSTVTKWRFKPMIVGSEARAACSAVTFDIRFD